MTSVLTQAPKLVPPDWENAFKMLVETSQISLGGKTKQEDNERRTGAIDYSSKKVKTAEKYYTTSDRELLAVV